MTLPTPPSLLQLLTKPVRSAKNANGWQRLWMIAAAVLLLIHFLVFVGLTPPLDELKPDDDALRNGLADAQARLDSIKGSCADASKTVQAVAAEYEATNRKGRELAQSQRAPLLEKLAAARARLFEIETSGGKYYSEWVKYRDSIEAYEEKLKAMAWTDRVFDQDNRVPPKVSALLKACSSAEGEIRQTLTQNGERYQRAKEARSTLLYVAIGVPISFLLFTLGLYGLGWVVGWVVSGFKGKQGHSQSQ